MNVRRRNRRGLWCVLLAAGLTAGTWAQTAEQVTPEQGQSPQALFESLFGGDLRRVSATPDAQDDIDLAAVLLQAASSADDKPQVMTVLIDHVVELGMRHGSGHDLASEALQLGIERQPEQRVHFLEKLVELRQRQYTQARGDDRAAAAKQLINALIRLADAQYQRQDFDGALVQLRRATAVASAIRSAEARQAVKARMDRVIAAQSVMRQIQSARARLTRDKHDTMAARELLRLYIVELDAPEEARKYSFLVDDETWQTNIRLASMDLAALSDEQAFALGEWYKELAGSAGSDRSRAAMLARAVAAYDQFLQQHDATDLLTTKAMLTRKQAAEALATVNQSLPEHDRRAPGDYGAAIDLLKLVDMAKHVERGQWVLNEAGLTTTDTGRNRIVFPVAPHGSYRLSFDVTTRAAQPRDIVVYLPVGASAVGLFLSHPVQVRDRDRDRSVEAVEQTAMGLAMVQQHIVESTKNPASVITTPLEPDTAHPVAVAVTLDGSQATIDVTLGEKRLVHWTGPVSELAPMNRWQPRTRSDVLGIHCESAGVRFTSVMFRMLDGQMIRTDEVGEPAVAEPDPEDEPQDARERWAQRIEKMRQRIDEKWDRMTFSQKNQLVLQLQRNPNPYIRKLGIELAIRIEREF